MADMTKREILAMAAMQGMVSGPHFYVPEPCAIPIEHVPDLREQKLTQLTRDAFAIADAMIQASNGTAEGNVNG